MGGGGLHGRPRTRSHCTNLEDMVIDPHQRAGDHKGPPTPHHPPLPLRIDRIFIFSKGRTFAELACARQLLFGWDMHRAAFRCQHSLAQALAQGWVRVNGFDDLVCGQFAAHGNRVFADEVGGVGSDDVRTQDFIVPAEDDFGEALGLANGYSFTDGRPGETLDARIGWRLRPPSRQRGRGPPREPGRRWHRCREGWFPSAR